MKPKIVIVYKSRYGATTQYAHLLSQALRVPAYESSEIADAKLNEYDIVIAGGPVYVGKIRIARWINEKKHILARKSVFLFVVCASPGISEGERAAMLSRNIDKSLANRIDATFLKGRMIKRDLSFVDRVVLRVGAALQKEVADKRRMLTDFDGVQRENLDVLVEKVKSVVAADASARS